MVKKSFLFLLVIMSLFVFPLFAEDITTGWIEGQILLKNGTPMSQGMVVFFKANEGPVPDAHKYLRIPDSVADLDEEGKFRVVLPMGKYFMGAIKRLSGEQIGPPQDGDYFFNSLDEEGNPIVYLIEKEKGLNAGVIAKAEPFKRTIYVGVPGLSGISGKILDYRNDPIEGAIVFAYITKTMTGLPAFTSYSSGKDGRFIITMDKGRNYYLRVRDAYGGGPPLSGDVIGVYGENAPAVVPVKTGEMLEDIVINVTRHFERGPKAQQLKLGVDNRMREKIKKKTEESRKKNNQ
jgi:hypothetical protein